MDPEFLDRQFKFTKGIRFVIVHDYLLFCPDFSENSP